MHNGDKMPGARRFMELREEWNEDDNPRVRRHGERITNPQTEREVAICSMLVGWIAFADDHRDRYGTPICGDHYTGQVWATQGRCLRDLLNCELDGLLGGELDQVLSDVAELNGFDPETWEVIR